MEQGPSWEADISSASGEILRLLKQKFPYRVHKGPPFIPVLSQINEVHAFPQHFFKIYFNIILLSSTPRSSKRSLPVVFLTKSPYAQFVKRRWTGCKCGVNSDHYNFVCYGIPTSLHVSRYTDWATRLSAPNSDTFWRATKGWSIKTELKKNPGIWTPKGGVC